MNEPWISNTGMVGGILGSMIGILGGVVGTLAGGFVPRGKAKRLTLGVNTFAFVLSFTSLVVGIIAYLSGQPRDVWYVFGYIGLLCTVGFGTGFWVILKRARDAELRKSMSEDLMLGGNEKDTMKKKRKGGF
ncbi:hypothetical protein F4X88_12485 [Candidatus Poribacteria bacterium]|nr:hypothetical protein [Candidatus Poribacteria bacterium]MYA57107.1 hypothetical protein [Candidatus Poribacteria bacterium]